MAQRNYRFNRRKKGNFSSITNSIFNLMSISVIILLVIGSQSFLSSFPTNIILNNETSFGEIMFDSIGANQITISGRQSQIENGDVITLNNGGHLVLIANQSTNQIDEAIKYGKYELNHILLLRQGLFDWDMEQYTLIMTSAFPSQRIGLQFHFSGDMLRVETPLTSYFIKYPQNSGLYISSDDGKILYKVIRTEKYISSVELIGLYDIDDEINVKLVEIKREQ